MKEKQVIVLNSVILYVTAFLLTTCLHELAHAIVGYFYNSNPVLHHNFVQHLSTEHLSVTQQLYIAFAGPFFSLFQGLLAGWLFLRTRTRQMSQLLLLWLSVLGFNNFLGYLMTGPLFSAGDIGKGYLLLGTPFLLQILAAVLGAAILLYIAYKLTRPFLEFSYRAEWTSDRKSRKSFSFHILILPWIIGSVVITILYLPIIAVISIIYPVMSGFVFIYPWQNAQRITDTVNSDSNQLERLSWTSLGICIVLIAVFKLILAPGIRL